MLELKSPDLNSIKINQLWIGVTPTKRKRPAYESEHRKTPRCAGKAIVRPEKSARDEDRATLVCKLLTASVVEGAATKQNWQTVVGLSVRPQPMLHRRLQINFGIPPRPPSKPLIPIPIEASPSPSIHRVGYIINLTSRPPQTRSPSCLACT